MMKRTVTGLVHDERLVLLMDEWDRRAAEMNGRTKRRPTKYKLGLMYDLAMDAHFTTEVYTSHNGIVLDPYPESPARTRAVWSGLVEAGIPEDAEVTNLKIGRMLTKEECSLVHDSDFWRRWEESEAMTEEERETLAKTYHCIYLNQESVRCARLAAGGVLECVDKVMEDEVAAAWAVVRPPGHHAEADSSGGFCMMNNVAIAAKYAVKEHGLERVLILDWDVHHGNGTQHMFYKDPKVLYISLHRYDHGKFYPSSADANYDQVGEGEGAGFNVNIPWNGLGYGDPEYLMAFLNIVLPITQEYNPQLILVSAGFDAGVGDPLSGYQCSPALYGLMTRHLATLAGGRLVIALEGGYNLDTLAEAGATCAQALLGHVDTLTRVMVSRETRADQEAVESVRNVIRAHGDYWKCLQG